MTGPVKRVIIPHIDCVYVLKLGVPVFPSNTTSFYVLLLVPENRTSSAAFLSAVCDSTSKLLAEKCWFSITARVFKNKIASEVTPQHFVASSCAILSWEQRLVESRTISYVVY